MIVAVLPVNRMAWRWSPAYVLQKSLKAQLPLGANADTSTPIKVIVRMTRIVASGFHGLPSQVLFTSKATIGGHDPRLSPSDRVQSTLLV